MKQIKDMKKTFLGRKFNLTDVDMMERMFLHETLCYLRLYLPTGSMRFSNFPVIITDGHFQMGTDEKYDKIPFKEMTMDEVHKFVDDNGIEDNIRKYAERNFSTMYRCD